MLSTRSKNLFILTFVTMLFVLPFFIAQYLYTFGNIKGAITNKGELITNPHNLSELNLDFKKFDNTDLFQENKWRILYNIPANCDSDCETILFQLQQAHIALGKNTNRLQRINIHNNIDKRKNDSIYSKFPHIVLSLNNNLNSNIIEPNYVYIADPLGNIILKYNTSNKNLARDILKDSKKLLNLSKIG